MNTDPATGLLPASGVYTENTAAMTTIKQIYADGLNRIPLQQQGQMFYSRPIYGVV
jgi:hypothetical protein